MSMGELEAFLAAAEELHFGRAAERLLVSPSRISQLIRRLEGRVGAPLFERTTRRVELTPVGARFHQDLRRIRADLVSALESARTAARGLKGTLRVGYLTHCGDEAFVRLVSVFGEAVPDADISTLDLTGTDYHEVLRSSRVDVLLGRFVVEPPPDLVRGPTVAREDWLLGIARDHPFAARQSVSVEELATQAIFGVPDAVTGELHNPLYPDATPQGLPIPRRGVARTFAEVLALVAQQENVFPVTTSFPLYYSHPDVVFLPLTGWPQGERTLVWRAHGNNDLTRAFIDFATARDPWSRPPAAQPAGYGDWWGPRAVDEVTPDRH